MAWYTIIAAAWFTTLVVRKLPGVRGLVERGVRPFACNICMSAWLTLVWNGGALQECGGWGVAGWLAFFGQTAALSAVVYGLLFAWALLLQRLGWVDDPQPSDYAPPEDPQDPQDPQEIAG